MLPEPTQEQIDFRVAIMDSDTPSVLAVEADGVFELPTIAIPGRRRTAEAITFAVEERWGMRTIMLTMIPSGDDRPKCAVLEVIRNSSTTPSGLVAAIPTELERNTTIEERRYLEALIDGGAVKGDILFKRGWLNQVEELIVQHLPDWFGGFSSDVKQLNLSEPFTLVRLGAKTGEAYWFKRVGPPNLHEFDVTLTLARHFPDCVPEVVCQFPEWNAWVTKEVVGQPLANSGNAVDAELALKTLVRLQQKSICILDDLREHGVRDATLCTVKARSSDFFAEMTHAMAEQTSTKSRALEPEELDTLKSDLNGLLEEAIQTNLPDTLIHLDIGHGNVLHSPSRPIFLDWAEAFYGHPFVTAEHMITDLQAAGLLSSYELNELREHYAQHWAEFASAPALARLQQLAPTLAVATYALIGWSQRPEGSARRNAWPFLRSLTRRIRTEIDRLPERLA